MRIRLFEPLSEQHWRQARELLEAYAASLGVDLSFQNFAHELEHLASEYAPPGGALLIAEADGVLAGCVGVRKFSAGVGEIKRLYVVPESRGRGVGRMLAEGIMVAARRLAYTRLLLDTLPSMREAQALYLSLGFRATGAYRFNPVPGTAYLEIDLTQPASTDPGQFDNSSRSS